MRAKEQDLVSFADSALVLCLCGGGESHRLTGDQQRTFCHAEASVVLQLRVAFQIDACMFWSKVHKSSMPLRKKVS